MMMYSLVEERREAMTCLMRCVRQEQALAPRVVLSMERRISRQKEVCSRMTWKTKMMKTWEKMRMKTTAEKESTSTMRRKMMEMTVISDILVVSPPYPLCICYT